MPTEVFRFMTIRPPQEGDHSVAASDTVDLNPPGSDFLHLLVKQNLYAPANALHTSVRQCRGSYYPS